MDWQVMRGCCEGIGRFPSEARIGGVSPSAHGEASGEAGELGCRRESGEP